MAPISLTQCLLLPVLLVLSLPVALCAALTTLVAFSVLFVRVLFVYIELALAIIPHYLFGPPMRISNPEYDLLKASAYFPTPANSRRKKRRTSSSSNISGTGPITSLSGENLLGLSQSIGITRDFEGVGGWRLDNNNSDDDGLWTNMNSRLELPADHGRRRHHHRSLTSGSVPTDRRLGRSGSPEEKVMNTSRVRTSPGLTGVAGEYFPSQKKLARNNSGSTGSSGNNGSSGNLGASMLVMKQR